ncbi:CUB domain-containing protein 1 [Gastrophryne carolinensis]
MAKHCPVQLLGLLITFLLPLLPESFTISSQGNVTILIKPAFGASSPPCYLCTGNNKCKDVSLNIPPGKTVDYSFSCTTPERYFIMEINRIIDCDLGACPLNISLLPQGLTGLNRTFFWHVSAIRSKGLVFGFPRPWLQQIHPSAICPGITHFKIGTYSGGDPVSIGTFCRVGTVSRIKVHEKGLVALSLPWNETIKDLVFTAANRSSIQRLCIVESNFQTESLVMLLSANYPSPFPSNEHMTWKFNMPPNYAAAVNFADYTTPMCEKNELEVQYYIPKRTTLKLHEKQPANIQDNFNFSLQNCVVDKRTVSQTGLTLNFNVTVQKTPGNDLYAIDLINEKDLRVRIGKRATTARQFTPQCKICRGPQDCDSELVLEGGKYYKISFFCQNLNILSVTVEKEIACWNITVCNITNEALRIPESFINFPVRLDSFTWKLLAPVYISTEITSKSIYLQQHTPNKPCNGTASSFTYEILSCNLQDEFRIGTFCPNGSIKKIQMRDNVTIVLNMPRTGNVRDLLKHDLRVSFVSLIEEECIFTVSPNNEQTVHLQTPNWEHGLPDFVSLSWNIKVPSKQYGRLIFAKNTMDIMCDVGTSYLNIREEQDKGPGILRRYDQLLPSATDLYSSFWVNISNCKPRDATKKLKLQLSVNFSNITPGIQYIIIAACTAVGVVFSVIVAICCVRKKKKQHKSPVGIYNSRVNTEAPRRQAFFKKARRDNESHVYAVIDDTMIYGHLLKETNGSIQDVDIYRPFEGPMGDPPPVPPVRSPNGSAKTMDPLARSMKENEIYMISEPIVQQPVENEDTSIPYIEDSENGTVVSA